eukprot:CAMPEP_0177783930 /NCGR_PEP_ID=MMETSP0491_2-20121128/19398_1 /TAXON_ID=63592 /ORGANISM="Tetraselmis chuii, Strain PLY429" /LENGTH=101 /DNA_ID=CAMNT_0019304599 /DNA_START=172 /DNA_END=474 /DNA_ORIENTATION=+
MYPLHPLELGFGVVVLTRHSIKRDFAIREADAEIVALLGNSLEVEGGCAQSCSLFNDFAPKHVPFFRVLPLLKHTVNLVPHQSLNSVPHLHRLVPPRRQLL